MLNQHKFHPELKKIIKYLIIGGINTLLAYLLFVLLVTLEVYYQLALFIVTSLVIIHGFMWHKHWTFRAPKTITPVKEFLRFSMVYFCTFALNSLLLFLFVEKICWDPRTAQLLCMVITTSINFVGHRFWTFQTKGEINL